MPKKILFLIVSVISHISFGQTERVTIQGKITSDSTFVENVHIINKNSRKATISNKYGEFQIPVKENDTLLFSAIQFRSKILIFKEALLENSQLIRINLQPKNNRLKEVIVKNPNNIAKGLGLPNADKKPLTKIESRLNYHTKASLPIAILATLLNKKGGINDMLYIASGNRKRDRKLQKLIDQDKFNIQTEKDIQNIRRYFKDTFFRETINIPTEEINFFIRYCLKKDIINLYYKEMYIEVIDIFISESKPYLKKIENE
jgi:hypothetical protein